MRTDHQAGEYPDHALAAELDRDEGLPHPAKTADRMNRELLAFVRRLRATGVAVPANAAVTAARTVVEVGFDRESVRVALRASLISDPAGIEPFETLFPEFWRRLVENGGSAVPGAGTDDKGPTEQRGDGQTPATTSPNPGPVDPKHTDPVRSGDRSEIGASDPESAVPTDESSAGSTPVYSPSGRSAPVDESRVSHSTPRGLRAAVRNLLEALAELEGRNWDRDGAARIDARTTLRRSLNTGGVAIDLPRRDRTRTAVRTTLLVDVSESVLDVMDREFLLRFLRLMVAESRSTRVFFFDTDLREVTDTFEHAETTDPAAALEAAELEWGGGTRIGESLATLRRTAPGSVDRRTSVLVLSDGLEVGSMDELSRGMAWLARRAGTTLWMNPLASADEYRPTAEGMATALPYADGLYGLATLEDVRTLADHLHQHGLRERNGYEYQRRRFTRQRRSREPLQEETLNQ